MSTASGWQAEWRRLSALIAGILEAGHFLVAARAAGADSHHADAVRQLLNRISTALLHVRHFWDNHNQQLSPHARSLLNSYVAGTQPRTDDGAGFASVVHGITLLAALRAEFEYVIADSEAVTRSLVARAFLHLQRSIIADESIREKWKQAFDSGEPRCEKLGDAHLLQHGIWAFKALAAGERTDLVLGEPVNQADAEGSAAALVLTEWKVVRNPGDTDAKAAEARRQASIYASSALAGFELTSRRYIVLVSKDRLMLPQGVVESGNSFEHIGIAVDPQSPSVHSRKA